MTGAKKLKSVSVEDYLEHEENSIVKHEYVGGSVHAMVGARNAHNIIAGNVYASLWMRLRGKSCRPFNSDTKIRLKLPTETRFYYPDVSVVCHQNSHEESYQDRPEIIIEVLSPSTRRIDEGEKKDAYMTIPSLCLYMLVEPDAQEVVAWRRTAKGFVKEHYHGLDAVIALGTVEAALELSEIYDGIDFTDVKDIDR